MAPASDFSGAAHELTAAVQQAAADGVAVVLLDAPFQKTNRWEVETWANGGAVQFDAEKDAVCMTPEEGPRGKWVVSLHQTVDVSNYESLKLEVRGEKEMAVAAGIWTGAADNPNLFESTPVAVKPGGWRQVSIALQGKGFKADSSDWKFGIGLDEPDKVRRISLFLYTDTPANLCWRNVRLVKGE
jgi:hypothetical protein